MRRHFAIGFAIAFLLAGCATHIVDVGLTGAPSLTLPATNAIASPDRAEVACYVAMKIAEASVLSIDQLHDAKVISDEKFSQLVGADESIANRVRLFAGVAYKAAGRWRATGDRTQFDTEWEQIIPALTALAKEAK